LCAAPCATATADNAHRGLPSRQTNDGKEETMKTLLLAAATVMTLGVGAAFAQPNGPAFAQPNGNNEPTSATRTPNYAAMNMPGSNGFNQGFTTQQQPSIVPEETAPIQPRYETVLPRAYEDDAGGGG